MVVPMGGRAGMVNVGGLLFLCWCCWCCFPSKMVQTEETESFFCGGLFSTMGFSRAKEDRRHSARQMIFALYISKILYSPSWIYPMEPLHLSCTILSTMIRIIWTLLYLWRWWYYRCVVNAILLVVITLLRQPCPRSESFAVYSLGNGSWISCL